MYGQRPGNVTGSLLLCYILRGLFNLTAQFSMLTNPHKTGRSRNRNQWGVITLAICALLVLIQCDSGFVPDTGPAPNSTDARVQAIQKWYDTALAEERSAPLPDSLLAGKFDDDSTLAAVLDAMVSQHPPDWDNMETWDNGHGGYWAATLLAGNPTSPTDPELTVVRTLVADVDENGQILGGLLIEFAARDLDESNFRDYVVQWIVVDYGNTPILVAEYTIGYASTNAMFYQPGEAPIPVTMRLTEKVGAGKTAAEIWYCYVSYYDRVRVCVEVDIQGGPTYEVCEWQEFTETTCVCVSGCYDDDGDGDTGGDCPNGCGDTGGGDDDDDDDSDDDDDEDDNEDITFSLSCDESVTRGDTASCTVRVEYAEGVDEKQHKFEWSSGDATFSMSDANGSSWQGTATEDVTIEVAVAAENYAAEAKISVDARPIISVSDLSASAQYTDKPTGLGLYGFYYASSPSAPVSGFIAGSGPWDGSYIAGNFSANFGFTSELHVSNDYDPETDKQPTYAPPHNVDKKDCRKPQELEDSAQSYYSINAHCRTSGAYNTMGAKILEHEEQHESSYNKCLAETSIFEDLEGIVDSTSSGVTDQIKEMWSGVDGQGGFLSEFHASGEYAKGYAGARGFFQRSGSSWIRATGVVDGHGGSSRSECN